MASKKNWIKGAKTLPELGWTAGIIDGEGTVTLAQRCDRSHQYQVRVMVANTDIAMILKLHSMWGGSFRKVAEKRLRRSDCFQWVVAAAQACDLLKQVTPYMVTKVSVSKTCLEYQSRLTLARGRSNIIPEGEKIIRFKLFSQVRKMNRKDRKWQQRNIG